MLVHRDMNIELDHFFILADPGAARADMVSSIGLVEGSGNTHPGQGTANRRFFFANTTLEFLYLRDRNEALTGRGRCLKIPERLDHINSSPFGLVVRHSSDSAKEPFPGERYCPEYFRDDQCFLVGENAGLMEEPLCICMPHNLPRPETLPEPGNPSFRLTELRIGVPVTRPSTTLDTISRCPAISVIFGQPHQIELVFNEGQGGQLHDLRPDLPLLVRW